MNTPGFSPEDLQQKLSENALLQEVPPEQLQWLCSRGELRLLKAGDELLKKDQPLDFLFIVLEGLIQLRQEQQGAHRIIDELEAGDISGALPYSRAKKTLAAANAKRESKLLLLAREHFTQMIQEAPTLTEALVHVMTSRVREFTHNQQQTEKLASLGKLSAGLHHELNNPAAAALRAATELKEKLQLAPDKFKKLMLLHFSPAQAEQIWGLLFSKQAPKSLKKLSLLERSGLDDDLAEWLESEGLDEASSMAETFSNADLNLEKIKKLREISGEKQFPPLIYWLYHLLSTDKLVADIQESTRRISALVGAVKSYSHMDRSPERELTNLAESIRNTLTILNFKLKHKKIKAEVQAPNDLPPICVYGGELNQVWTNLIDNAIDAMPESGQLNISLKEEKGGQEILIKDNGSGIPEELRERIFDPFFTTKSMGEGSGMGLDLVKQIVERHGGTITVDSSPGETVFKIFLPHSA